MISINYAKCQTLLTKISERNNIMNTFSGKYFFKISRGGNSNMVVGPDVVFNSFYKPTKQKKVVDAGQSSESKLSASNGMLVIYSNKSSLAKVFEEYDFNFINALKVTEIGNNFKVGNNQKIILSNILKSQLPRAVLKVVNTENIKLIITANSQLAFNEIARLVYAQKTGKMDKDRIKKFLDFNFLEEENKVEEVSKVNVEIRDYKDLPKVDRSKIMQEIVARFYQDPFVVAEGRTPESEMTAMLKMALDDYQIRDSHDTRKYLGWARLCLFKRLNPEVKKGKSKQPKVEKTTNQAKVKIKKEVTRTPQETAITDLSSLSKKDFDFIMKFVKEKKKLESRLAEIEKDLQPYGKVIKDILKIAEALMP